nr:hypothetical protein [Methylosinus sp. Sm6]
MGAKKALRRLDIMPYHIIAEIEPAATAQNIVGDGFQKAGRWIEGAIVPAMIAHGCFGRMNLARMDHHHGPRFGDPFSAKDAMPLRAPAERRNDELVMKMRRIAVVETGRAQQLEAVRQSGIAP